MATDNVGASSGFRLRSFKRRHYVCDHGRLWNARSFWLFEGLLLDCHATAGLFRNFREFAEQPIARCADAAGRIGLRRKCVARAEGDEFANCSFDVARVNFLNDSARSAVVWRRSLTARPRPRFSRRHVSGQLLKRLEATERILRLRAMRLRAR